MGGQAQNGKRVRRDCVIPLTESFLTRTGLTDVAYYVCGSYRRGRPDCGDIEIVFYAHDEEVKCRVRSAIREIFGNTEQFEPKMQGLFGTVQFDLFLADSSSLGAMLLHATGSGLFNIKMRTRARERGLKLNQYGLWRITGEPVVLGMKEEDIFTYLGMDFIKPEDRT